MPALIENRNRIFLTGVACVGKTAIGKQLASLLGFSFYDLDAEVETFYGTSIERLQNRYFLSKEFQRAAPKVLQHILSKTQSSQSVIALPPSGLKDAYWSVVQKTAATTVVILDHPENILNRITFFDLDSKPIEKTLSTDERRLYLKEIQDDIRYFRRSYKKATLSVDISGLNVEESAYKVKSELEAQFSVMEHHGSFLQNM